MRQIFRTAFLFSVAVLNLVGHAAEKRPNILFIFTDDHALQAIGAYGSRINETPNIDRLAREGAVYENSFCANSICGPSRACILTGKHSHINGFLRNGNRFVGTQTTFPPLMQQGGYQTALVGKWHLNTKPIGFDYWEVLPGQGSYYNPDFDQMDGTRKRYNGYCTDIITDKAISWLEQRDQEKPFILMCQHKAPHRNWAPAPRHFSMFEDEDVPEPETLFDDYAGRSKLLLENEMSLKDHFHWGHDMKFHGEVLFPKFFAGRHGNGEYARMTDEQKQIWDAKYEPENQEFIARMRAGTMTPEQILRWKYQRYIKDYLKCIAAVDDGVGKLLSYLDDNGLAENTIVIYSSDQGFYLGEHGWYDKRWMFEESLKMPFLVRWPGVVKAGTRSRDIIQNIDYGPTFLNVAGVEVPEEMQGRSLVPLLTSGEAPSDWRDAIYYAYYENASVHNVPVHDGVRTERYKLMFFPRNGEWQLFDLEEDPMEMKSVHADQARYGGILTAMQKRYRDLRSFYKVNPAVIPTTRGEEAWWKKRDGAIRAGLKDRQVDLAFIGDSITQGWEGAGNSVWKEFYADRNPVNLGFGGDRTEHVIWRLTRNQLESTTPKVAVVMIGTNNTGHRLQDPQEVADGIERILEILKDKTPSTKVLLLGVFPRGKQPYDVYRMNNVAINQIIRRHADEQRVFYRDIGNVFLESDRSISPAIMPDALHLSTEGYKRWAEAIEPLLKELGV